MKKIIRTSTIGLSLNVFCRGTLKELGQRYDVVAVSTPDADLDEVASREGVRVVPVNMERKISPLKDLMSLVRLYRVFKREKPAMVHSMTPKAGLLSMMAARLAGVPARVHSFTGLIFPTATGIKRRILMLTDKLTCLCASHVLAEGQGVKDDLTSAGITRKEIRILGYGNVRGIDLDYYNRENVVAEASQIRESLHLTSRSHVFIFVGRLTHDKGVDELIEAFRTIESEGHDVRLILVGEEEREDPLEPRNSEYIRQSANVVKTGWQKDVRPYYGAADTLVFPSHREGFPNVVLEAGAMELPAIVTDINGSREIIQDGVTGVIIPPADTEKLTSAMRSWLTDTGKEKEMGRNARALVAARYEQGFVRQKLMEFYHSLLG